MLEVHHEVLWTAYHALLRMASSGETRGYKFISFRTIYIHYINAQLVVYSNFHQQSHLLDPKLGVKSYLLSPIIISNNYSNVIYLLSHQSVSMVTLHTEVWGDIKWKTAQLYPVLILPLNSIKMISQWALPTAMAGTVTTAFVFGRDRGWENMVARRAHSFFLLFAWLWTKLPPSRKIQLALWPLSVRSPYVSVVVERDHWSLFKSRRILPTAVIRAVYIPL